METNPCRGAGVFSSVFRQLCLDHAIAGSPKAMSMEKTYKLWSEERGKLHFEIGFFSQKSSLA